MDHLKSKIPDYAKDIRVNLGNLLSIDNTPGLTEKQNVMIFLVAAYTSKSAELISEFYNHASHCLSEQELLAVKSAACIMAMNTIYYRSVHLAENENINQLPAKLRMTIIGNPGIEKRDFELLCLCVAAMAGCGKCIASHIHELSQQGVSNEGIQSVLRISAVVNASAMALSIS